MANGYQVGKLADGTPLNIGVYRGFINAGLSPNQAMAMTAEVGRENGFNAGILFGSHIDPAGAKGGGTIKNSGMLSWNGSRGTNLVNYLRSQGVMGRAMARTQANLDAQARFAVQEMKSRAYRGKLQHFWSNPNANPESFARELGKNYIVWAYGQNTIAGKSGGRVAFDWRSHDNRRRDHLQTLNGMLGGKAVNPYANARQSVVNQASQYANFYRANRDSLGFSQHSLAQLDGVHGDLGDVVALAKKIIKQKDPNLTFQITEGMRSQATQNKYLSKGKTKVKVSKHQHGGAVDVVAVRNGKSHYNFDDYYVIADAMAQASSQLGVNVRWGGSWSTLSPSVSARDALASYKKRSAKPFLDGVHFELADLDQSTGRYVSRRLPVAMGGQINHDEKPVFHPPTLQQNFDMFVKKNQQPTFQPPKLQGNFDEFVKKSAQNSSFSPPVLQQNFNDFTKQFEQNQSFQPPVLQQGFDEFVKDNNPPQTPVFEPPKLQNNFQAFIKQFDNV